MIGGMRQMTSIRLEWQEDVNNILLDCSVDVTTHPSNNKVVLLTIPGVDGTVDGFMSKYVRIAEHINKKHGAAVVRMSNPFITSCHWEQNIRKTLSYIDDNSEMIAGRNDIELRIMGHSAGAAVIAQIAWEYPFITRLLLVNPAVKLDLARIKQGLVEFGAEKTTILVGSADPSVADIKLLREAKGFRALRTEIAEGADHHFSGEAFQVFLQAPEIYLFETEEHISNKGIL